MRLRFPYLWVALVIMWLALNGALTFGDVILAALAASAGVLGLALLQQPVTRVRKPWVAATLVAVVVVDIVRSNLAVAGIVLQRGSRGMTSGFVDIPLELRHPTALAALACIITSTPGTAWAGYDSQSGVLTMHVLDLVDKAESVRAIKERYERPLLEIFQ